MSTNNAIRKAVRHALYAGALATAAGYAPLAVAQDDDDEGLEEITVTGSRIQKTNLVTASPVVQLDSEQFLLSGATRVEDLLGSMPQVYLDQSSGQSIESVGTATMQLRNLGTSRTMVLVNGKRLPQHSPSSATSGPDLNFIPMQLVERVEVLTGGASSTYGSDAIAGVVNFIMIDDFEGVKLDYQLGGYRHDNDGNAASASTELVFPGLTPTGTSSDGDISDITLIVGGNLADGRGNITAYATKRDIDPVIQVDRDYSGCANRVQSSGDLRCLGSGTNQSGSFYFDNDGFNALYHVDGTDLAAGSGAPFNFAAPSYYQRPDERYTIGAFAHYELHEQVEAYAELMFMDNRSVAQFGPAGVFFLTHDFNCGNPLLSAQQRTTVGCVGDPTDFSTPGVGGLQSVTAIYGRRNVEGGPRRSDFRHSTYRILAGIRGEINETWRYDASFQYAEVDMRNVGSNYVDTGKADDALDVDASGNCLNGNPTCVPWNIWQTGGVDAAQIGWINQRWNENGQTDQQVISAYVQGSLGDYGWVLPSASSGVEFVFGLERREETLNYQISDNAAAGEVGGLGAALVPVVGGYDVNEAFIEASIPLIEGKSAAEEVIVHLGYRYSDYDPSGQTTDTYKIAGSWAFNQDFKLRGSYQRAVRAANLNDQFQPQQGNLFAMDNDPCNKVNPGDATSIRGYTFEQCALSGVSQAQWDLGGPANSPAAQYNTLIGGSIDLAPEESDTYSFGVVWTPSFADLVVSLDWYDIDVQDAITNIGPETTLLQCIETGSFCDLIRRGTNDSLWLGLATATNGISALSSNIGFFRVEGIDAEITYSFDVGNMGSVTLNNVTGLINEWEQEEFVGAGIQNCEGVYGGSCEAPTVELRNRFQALWSTPWNATISLGWRYIGEVDQIGSGNNPPLKLDAMNYIDLAGSWSATEWLNIRAGVNNLMDEEPPLVSQGVTARENGNTYPGAYDALGMYWFVGASVEF